MPYIVFQWAPKVFKSRLRKIGTKYSFVSWISCVPSVSVLSLIERSA